MSFGVTQNFFPETVECNGKVSSSLTSPNITQHLQEGVDYWNQAMRLATNETGPVAPDTDLLRVVTDPHEVEPFVTFRVGLCECNGVSGETTGTQICLDPSKNSGQTTKTLAHLLGRGMGLSSVSGHKGSVMSADGDSLYYDRYPCNVNSDHVLPYDVKLAGSINPGDVYLDMDSLSPEFMEGSAEGGVRTVEGEFDLNSFPRCRVFTIADFVKRSFMLQVPVIGSNFVAGVVKEVIDSPTVKNSKHFKIYEKVADLIPHLVFIGLLFAFNPSMFEVMVGITVMTLTSLMNQFLRCIPCCKHMDEERNRKKVKAIVYKIVLHPMFTTLVAALATSGASFFKTFPHSTPSIISTSSELFFVIGGIATGYFTGFGSARLGHYLGSSLMQKTYLMKELTSPNQAVYANPSVDHVAIEMEPDDRAPVNPTPNSKESNKKKGRAESLPVVFSNSDGSEAIDMRLLFQHSKNSQGVSTEGNKASKPSVDLKNKGKGAERSTRSGSVPVVYYNKGAHSVKDETQLPQQSQDSAAGDQCAVVLENRFGEVGTLSQTNATRTAVKSKKVSIQSKLCEKDHVILELEEPSLDEYTG